MNYRHIYHAGGFADVMKHLILIALLDKLAKKPKPFCYLDTHAGSGLYDLTSLLANKTKEFELGIQKIISHTNPPLIVSRYLNYIQSLNEEPIENTLRFYPGSPLIARFFSRPADRIISAELHPEEYQMLKKNSQDLQIIIHHMDGFHAVKAFLPPIEKRGLVFIDPPYESSDETAKLLKILMLALKRFSQGVFCIWFPLKDQKITNNFYQALEKNIKNTILIIELSIYPVHPSYLSGSSMIIVNPPWLLLNSIEDFLPWLFQILSINQQGSSRSMLINSGKIEE